MGRLRKLWRWWLGQDEKTMNRLRGERFLRLFEFEQFWKSYPQTLEGITRDCGGKDPLATTLEDMFPGFGAELEPAVVVGLAVAVPSIPPETMNVLKEPSIFPTVLGLIACGVLAVRTDPETHTTGRLRDERLWEFEQLWTLYPEARQELSDEGQLGTVLEQMFPGFGEELEGPVAVGLSVAKRSTPPRIMDPLWERDFVTIIGLVACGVLAAWTDPKRQEDDPWVLRVDP